MLSRDAILEALVNFPGEFARAAVEGRGLDELFQPGSDGGWGIIEILCHLADWEEIYFERSRLVVGEDHPYLPGHDDELWPIERNYRGQDPVEVFERFRGLRDEHVAYLAGLSDDAWQRTGEHGYFGNVSLQWMANHICEHDQEHLHQSRDVFT
jgi:hypothetical protein